MTFSSRLRIDPCLILDTLESATCRTSGTQPSERQYSETGVLRRPTVTQYSHPCHAWATLSRAPGGRGAGDLRPRACAAAPQRPTTSSHFLLVKHHGAHTASAPLQLRSTVSPSSASTICGQSVACCWISWASRSCRFSTHLLCGLGGAAANHCYGDCGTFAANALGGAHCQFGALLYLDANGVGPHVLGSSA